MSRIVLLNSESFKNMHFQAFKSYLSGISVISNICIDVLYIYIYEPNIQCLEQGNCANSLSPFTFQYEPLLQSDNSDYISNIIVYECRGSGAEFAVHARDRGQLCYQPNTPSLLFTKCSSVIIAWALGSKVGSYVCGYGEATVPLLKQW